MGRGGAARADRTTEPARSGGEGDVVVGFLAYLERSASRMVS